MLEGKLLSSNMAAKTFDSYAQMCCKRYHTIFWSLSAKFVFRKS